MMNILTELALAVYIIAVPSIIYGNVSKGNHMVRTVSTVECISGSDIKLQFISETDTNTSQTIAECKPSIRSCYLTEQSLGENYAVYYTGFGAKLSVVTDDEQTRGTYICCEIYNSSNCIDLGSKWLLKNTTKCVTDRETNDQTNTISVSLSTCSPGEVLIICQIVLTACLITLIYMKRKQVFSSSKACFQRSRRTEERFMIQEQGIELEIETPLTTEEINLDANDTTTPITAETNQVADEETAGMLHEDNTEKVILPKLPFLHAAAMKEDPHSRGDVHMLQRFIDDQRRLLRRYEDMLDDDFVSVHNTEKLETKTGVGTGMKINIWPLDLERNVNVLESDDGSSGYSEDQ